jgi:oxygen tolerance protein BatD
MKGEAKAATSAAPATPGAPAAGAAAPGPAAAVASGPVTVSLAVDRRAVTVGDPITITLTVHRPQKAEIVSFDPDRSLDALTLLDRKEGSPRTLPDGSVEEVRTLTLAAYETGHKEIPAITVVYRDAAGREGRVATAPVGIDIASVLTAGQTEPADIKPPWSMPARMIWPWVAAGALLLLALAWFLWWRRRRRRAEPSALPAPVVPKRPAHEIAYEELERLLASDRLARGAIKEFYIELAEIVRRYLEACYGIDTFERTTGEIVDALLAARVSVKPVAMTGDLLQACDLVKFAKYRPESEETRRAVEAAYRLVDETRQAMAPQGEIVVAAAAGGRR